MTELALDDRDRNPLHEELVGHGVTKTMGVDTLLDARTLCAAYEHLSDHRLGHPAALLGAEE